ncbi:hypothetical protein ES708_02367 [subsurface metagenome]
MKAWKAAEYSAAKALGGKRVPLSGGQGIGTKGDVELPGWLVEVKYRRHFSIWSIFREVEKRATAEGKNALLILKEKDKHGELAVMRIEYFKDLEEAKPNGRTN